LESFFLRLGTLKGTCIPGIVDPALPPPVSSRGTREIGKDKRDSDVLRADAGSHVAATVFSCNKKEIRKQECPTDYTVHSTRIRVHLTTPAGTRLQAWAS